jgi:hypothetical protein
MTAKQHIKIKMGLSALNKEIPLLFMATSSKLSLKFPKVIKPATMIVSGIAIGTKSANE